MNPQSEPTPDQELSDVMKQIAAFTASEQSQALSGAAVSPTEPAAVVTQQAAPLPSAPAATEAQSLPGAAPNAQPAPSTPAPPQPPRGTPNVLGDARSHDVVQVNNRDNQHHGVFFTIGAIKDGWVHGYRLTEHGGKDFITVKAHEVHRIGPAKVRSQVPCSRQWIEQHQQHGKEK